MKDIGFLSSQIFKSEDDKSLEKFQIYKQIQNNKNNYIGNKKKLLLFLSDFIEKNVDFKYNKIVDVFGGSGVISIFFAKFKKDIEVIYNDALVSTTLSVQNIANPLKDYSFDDLVLLTYPVEKKHFQIRKKYEEFLSSEEINFIENYLTNVVEKYGSLQNDKNIESIYWWAFLQNFIISYCFKGGRLNKNQILSAHDFRKRKYKINNIFSFNKLRKYFLEYQKSFLGEKDGLNININNSDAVDVIMDIQDVDFIYIDPPYGDFLSNYAYMYSFFEELFFQKPYEKIVEERSFLLKYNKKTKYKNNLQNLLQQAYPKTIIFSCNNNGWLDIDEILNLFHSIGYSCKYDSYDYDYKYCSRDKNRKIKEYIIKADKR